MSTCTLIKANNNCIKILMWDIPVQGVQLHFECGGQCGPPSDKFWWYKL